MRCPIMNTIVPISPDKTADIEKDCITGECAWWSSDHERCGIAMATQQLYRLNKNLETMARELSKLPSK